METLTCEQCNSTWKRQPSRGRKPRLCPSCLSNAQPTVSSQTVSKPSVSLDTNSSRTYKFPAPTRWICPSCAAGVQIGVSLDHAPTHACRKRLKKVFPLELVRAKEA